MHKIFLENFEIYMFYILIIAIDINNIYIFYDLCIILKLHSKIFYFKVVCLRLHAKYNIKNKQIQHLNNMKY